VKSKKFHFSYLSTLFAAAVLAGCAAGSGGGTKGDDSSVLRTRATERWDLLIGHKAEKAWDYLTPGYRETKTREQYAEEMNNRPVVWTKVTYGSQDCDADTCKVHLVVDYKINMGGMAGTVKSIAPLVETWIRVKGTWYYLPEALQPSKLGGNS
jgi:hypothetical protein